MVLKDAKRVVGGSDEADLATVSRHQVSRRDAPSTPKSTAPAVYAPSRTRQQTKVCRIAEERNVYYENPRTLMEEDIPKLWYRVLEWKQMKFEKAKLAQDIIAADQMMSRSRVTFQTVLMKVFEKCCETREATEDLETVKPRYAAGTMIISPTLFSRLSRTLELCPSRIGMECHAVPVIAIRQNIHRTELRRSIKSIQNHHRQRQQQHQREGIVSMASSSSERYKMEECIRLTSQSYSRPSRLYAQLIAHAHAATIIMEDDESSL